MIDSRPSFHPRGMPEHGASWGLGGVVLRARSRGPGVAVPVRSPRPGPPRRIVTGNARLGSSRDRITLTSDLPDGQEFYVVAEFA